MANNQETLSKLSALQNSIWQSASMTVSEAANQAINLGNGLTLLSPVTELTTELTQPYMVIQFAFADTPDSAQILLLSQEHFSDFAALTLDRAVDEVDESVVAEMRPTLEALVQGLCIAVGNIRNDAVVASGLSLRFQIFTMPPNFQEQNEIFRTNVGISGEGLNGTLIWLIDPESAAMICGTAAEAEAIPAAADFGQAESPFAAGQASDMFRAASATPDSNPGLDLLMDIPLEISVELGRVKMQVREVVDLGAGSIVEIDKAAGEPVDVLVNGRLVAKGEVVVIEDNFGVRITEILSQADRLQRLNEAA
ncbi:MAG: flagellar motor switch protein FliN [Armatimonadetes bacterium]|nr:flagellar motor switch protein FliN [Armatimonadota bacterium]